VLESVCNRATHMEAKLCSGNWLLFCCSTQNKCLNTQWRQWQPRSASCSDLLGVMVVSCHHEMGQV